MAPNATFLYLWAALLLRCCTVAVDWTPVAIEAHPNHPVQIKGETCSRFSLQLSDGASRIWVTPLLVLEHCDVAHSMWMTMRNYSWDVLTEICSPSIDPTRTLTYFRKMETKDDKSVYFDVYNHVARDVTLYSECISDFVADFSVDCNHKIVRSGFRFKPVIWILLSMSLLFICCCCTQKKRAAEPSQALPVRNKIPRRPLQMTNPEGTHQSQHPNAAAPDPLNDTKAFLSM